MEEAYNATLLDSMILQVFSNLNGSMTVLFIMQAQQPVSTPPERQDRSARQ